MVNNSELSIEKPSSRPAVSVLMPVYNEEPTLLDQACQSILAQSFVDFEFVIVDDGSQRQETVTWLQAATGIDSRLRILHESHRGLTATLNVGLSHCRGVFICRQDSDDWSDPERLACQVEFLQQHRNVGVVGSRVALHQYDGTPLWMNRLPTDPQSVAIAFDHMNPFCHGAICFRRDAAAAIGGYREEFSTSQDYDFLWRLCDRFGGANIPKALYHHRFTPASISANRGRDQAVNRSLARRLAAMRSRGLPEDFQSARQEIEATLKYDDLAALLKHGDHLLLAGHYLPALKANLRAMLRAPLRRLPYLKTLRSALFMLAPSLRPRLFGHTSG